MKTIEERIIVIDRIRLEMGLNANTASRLIFSGKMLKQINKLKAEISLLKEKLRDARDMPCDLPSDIGSALDLISRD